MEEFLPGTAAYVVSAIVRLRGPLDRHVLQDALDAVVARHDSLRMSFPSSTDGRPTMHITDAARVILHTKQAEDADHARRLVADCADAPFDLAQAPLVRALLVRLDADDHVFHLAVHHIVCDGWSMDILMRDVAGQYGSIREGFPAPIAPKVRYADFAAAQRQRMDGTVASSSPTGGVRCAGYRRLTFPPTGRERRSGRSAAPPSGSISILSLLAHCVGCAAHSGPRCT